VNRLCGALAEAMETSYVGRWLDEPNELLAGPNSPWLKSRGRSLRPRAGVFVVEIRSYCSNTASSRRLAPGPMPRRTDARDFNHGLLSRLKRSSEVRSIWYGRWSKDCVQDQGYSACARRSCE
jgi:hypothetical protein